MPVSYERESEDLSYIEKFTTPQVVEWLTNGFLQDDFKGIYHYWKRDFVNANFVRQLWEQSSPLSQRKVGDAVTVALANWNFLIPQEALHEFAYLAAFIREDRAVPSLIKMIDNHTISDSKDDNGELDTKSAILSILAGFAPREDVREAFEKWFYDQSFDQTHAAQLLVGLMICRPEDGLRYLNRFFEIEKNMPAETFSLDFLCSALQRKVGSDRLAKIISDLPAYAKEKMIKQILENAEIDKKWREENPDRAAYYDELEKREKSQKDKNKL